VLDLASASRLGYFNSLKFDTQVFSKDNLNEFLSLGKPIWRKVRDRISELLNVENAELRDNAEARKKVLLPISEVELLMPVKIGDYTDFYSSLDHASNMGKMLRDPDNALLPNWKHIPVAYHGRASSIVVSGTNFHRPKGQMKPAGVDVPEFGPTQLLDFELETAFIIGKATKMGESVPTNRAIDHIFGMVLFNDWSARDIQSWEYLPLGPFLGKNFASTISPWVVTLDALEPYRVEGYKQEPKVLPYLEHKGKKNIDINLEVFIQPKKQEPVKICTSNYKYMYWVMEQQLAHHTVNGCNINVGDMMASGTISGPKESSFGSMMELTWRGTKPIKLPDGSERKFIEDGDTLIIKGYADKNDIRIGFGECRAMVLPAVS
jgi:fumarylacetoacetase